MSVAWYLGFPPDLVAAWEAEERRIAACRNENKLKPSQKNPYNQYSNRPDEEHDAPKRTTPPSTKTYPN
jgi:hypothetical protein